MSVSQSAQIFDLMSQLDSLPLAERLVPDHPLESQSMTAQAIVAQIAAEENRDALREWYARCRGKRLNRNAESCRSLLESITGERLR